VKQDLGCVREKEKTVNDLTKTLYRSKSKRTVQKHEGKGYSLKHNIEDILN
jgi:hypothetical protein